MSEETKISEARRREQKELPPLNPNLLKAYVLLLEGVFHVTMLNELADKLAKEDNESAVEIARSSLVMGGACLDAATKQTIRDCLLLIAELDPLVRKQLTKRIGRSLKKDKDNQILADLLVWREIALKEVLNDIIDDIVSGSLQSVEQMKKVHKMFEVEFTPSAELGKALHARNQIVHEMDAITPLPELQFDAEGNLVGERRRKRELKTLSMWAIYLIETAHTLLRKIDFKFEELKSRAEIGVRHRNKI